MACLFWRPLRLLPPLQPTFAQPFGLRSCTQSHSRFLSSSTVLQVRKPSKAVYKPSTSTTPPRKKQQKDAVAHQQQRLDIPFKTHSPRVAPPTSAASSFIQPQEPATTQHTEHIAPAPPHSPLKPTLDYIPGGRKGVVASLRELATAESPTLIYEATKPRPYVAWCLFASLLLGSIAAVQIGFFTSDPSQSDLRIASVFLLTALIWAVLSAWTAFGATDVVKRIWALPSATGRPVLRIEPVRIWLGRRPLPFEVPVGQAFSDKSFHQGITQFDAMRHVRRKPGVLDSLFAPVGTIMTANLKMCQRKSSFAQLRVSDQSTWKVDLRDCKALDGGEVLDLLILPSQPKRSWIARLFLKDD